VDYSEGCLFLDGKEWVLDAEPHVTTLFERLFLKTKTRQVYEWSDDANKYRFTHRPRLIQDMLSVRKDLAWFIDRFDLQVSDRDKQLMLSGAKKHDVAQQKARKSYFEHEPINLDLALPLRKYQEQALSLALHRQSLLIADQVGLGKTPIGVAAGMMNLPALCVVPPHLTSQWEYEIKKFLPKAAICKIQSGKIDVLPPADFYVVSYYLVGKYVEELTKHIPIKSLILDEAHSLRHSNTNKYAAVAAISEGCVVRVGLSATPIMNYGTELFNIFEILEPGALGNSDTFYREWCVWGKIRDAELLGNYLRKNMMMVRRTRKDVGRELAAVERVAYTVDADMATLKKLEAEAKVLALKVITGDFHESGEAARQFDYKVRHATGVAKARSVAEIVKPIVESGEKVVLFGWHRDVYDIWLKELQRYRPVMYTGSEDRNKKEESLKEFIDGEARVFIMSLRSGAGVNGLQNVCSYAVFGELDWSPGVIDQCIGRIWREGQEGSVTAIFVTINDGADPFMKKVIGLKATEAKQIINPDAEVLASGGGADRVLGLAKDWLVRQGEDVEKILDDKAAESRGELFIPAPKQGDAVFELWDLLRSATLNPNSEADMQGQVEALLRDGDYDYVREAVLSERSRVDFRVGNVLVECKVDGFNKRSLLRQLKRYLADCPETEAIIALTPEFMNNFKLKGVPVYSINVSDNSLLMSGLS
jgi:superfamily II DNA or RNA helicase